MNFIGMEVLCRYGAIVNGSRCADLCDSQSRTYGPYSKGARCVEMYLSCTDGNLSGQDGSSTDKAVPLF